MKWLTMLCLFILIVMPVGMANAMNLGERAGHFNVTNYIGPVHHVDSANLYGKLEKAYDSVNGYFGTCPDRIEVIIVDNPDMDKVGKQVDSFSAWNKLFSAIVLRRSVVENNKTFPIIAEHEMTHLAINDILHKKDSREFQWMEEGICTLVSKEQLDDVDVSTYIVSHGFLNTSEIYDAIKNENCSISKNGYMQSYCLVKYIVQRYGMQAIINMLECPDVSFAQAFRRCTGEDFNKLYSEWENNVKASASG